MNYYVYAYLRTADNTPYYIGKGKNNRAFSKHKGITIPSDKSKIIFLETNLTNVGACAIERRMIMWYGRKDLHTGILLNRTSGGDGTTSCPLSEAHKQKIRISSAGRKHSEKTKCKISHLMHGNKNGVGNKSRTGQHQSDEERKKKSLSLTGEKNPNYGIKFSDERKEQISMTMRNRPKSECPHCHRLFDPANFSRYHGNNCKLNKC